MLDYIEESMATDVSVPLRERRTEQGPWLTP